MTFTACANIQKSSENTTESQETTESSAESTQKKFYPYYCTSIRETKALQTEVSALQEKLDWNDIDILGFEDCQKKVIVQIGDHRDVPYIFECGGGYWVRNNGLCLGYMGTPYFKDIQAKEEYMPVYTYTGTESVIIEFNDEIVNVLNEDGEAELKLEVFFYDESSQKSGETFKRFENFEEIYENLPKGKYYVGFVLDLQGDYVFEQHRQEAELVYWGIEHTHIMPVFILEIK